MRSKNLGLYAVALAIAVVGAVWAGLPPSILLVLALFLTCPLMMFVMMRGMHGSAGHDQHARAPGENRSTTSCRSPRTTDITTAPAELDDRWRMRGRE